MVNRVWIVEMKNPINNQWGPTVGIGLDRDDARQRLAEWKTRNPWDKFRVRKYVEATP